MSDESPPISSAPTQAIPSPDWVEHHTVLAGRDTDLTSQPARVFEAGTVFADYRIMRLIARGGMGEVYLARDTKLGRKVALKMIHPEFLNSRQARARFFEEARTTAKFNHPHIVGIHAVGEVEGCPYVALEFLEGENLRQHLALGRFGDQRTAQVALAIAEALAEAHDHEVLHRDLKPENVMFDRDGRVRVVDFGLAKDLAVTPLQNTGFAESDKPPSSSRLQQGVRATGRMGTPLYMAPEQWRGDSSTQATDIWALGTLMYEMATGRVPYDHQDALQQAMSVCDESPAPDPAEFGVPDAISRLILSCMHKTPEQRPSAKQLVSALRELVTTPRIETSAGESPFRGLLPFSEQHAALFCGREAEIEQFLARLRVTPLLAVVGPSASGKTSFVRAGVTARLLQEKTWLVLRLRPGKRPLLNLASKVIVREGDSSSERLSSPDEPPRVSVEERIRVLAHQLRNNPRQLSTELRHIVRSCGQQVLLFVDQFEEVFSLCDDVEEQKAFVAAVLTAADDALDPIRVVFTMRHDHLDRLAESPEGRVALQNVTVLQRPGPQALREAIIRPVHSQGYQYESGELVDEMIEAVRDVSNGLALLQFTGQLLWAERDKDRLLLLRQTYEQLGGVEGALATHADGVVQGLPGPQQEIARSLLLRLVVDGKARRLSRPALVEGVQGEPELIERVLRKLTEERLIGVIRATGPDGAEAQLELAHESLLDAWGSLSNWIEQGREETLFVNEVEQAAALWQRRGRRRDELWLGEALQEAESKLRRFGARVPKTAKNFLSHSREEERRTRRRKRYLLGGVIGLLAVVAFGATTAAFAIADKERLAVQARVLAETERSNAENSRAEALREGARSAKRQGDLLEARAKLRLAMTAADAPAARALWWQLSNTPLQWSARHAGSVYGVAFSPDGRHVASCSQDKTLHIINTKTRATRILRGHRDQAFSVAYAPNGEWIASGSWSGRIRIWNAKTGEPHRILEGHTDAIPRLHFSHDSKRLLSASWDGTARIWDLALGAMTLELKGHTGRVLNTRFNPQSSTAATAGQDHTIKLWDTRTGQLQRTLTGHTGDVKGLAFLPGAERLVSASSDHTLRVWHLHSNAPPAVLQGHTAKVSNVDVSANGKRAISASTDGTLRLWDLTKNQLIRTFRQPGRKKTIYDVAFDPNGQYIVSGGQDQTVRLWRTGTETASNEKTPHRGSVNTVRFSPNGTMVASVGLDQTVRLWDIKTAQQTRILKGHDKGLVALAFSGDGRKIATGGYGNSLRIWNVEDSSFQTLTFNADSIWSLSFSADSATLASSHWSGAVRLWSLDTGTFRQLDGHRDTAWAVNYAKSSPLLASAGRDGSVRLWDPMSGAQRHVFVGHEAAVHGVVISPDGQTVASASHDQTVRVWSVGERNGKLLGRHDGRVYGISYHPTLPLIASSSADGTARLWRTDSRQSITLRGHYGEVNSVDFSPDGRLLATASDDGSVRLWQVDDGRPYWRAPIMLTNPARLLSHVGWERLDEDATKPLWSWGSKARKRLETAGIKGSIEQSDSPLLCLEAEPGTIEAWNLKTDSRLFQRKLGAIREVIADKGSCLVWIHNGRETSVQRHPTEGDPHELARGTDITALALHRSARKEDSLAMVIKGGNHLEIGALGKLKDRGNVGLNATAVLQKDDTLLVGYADGEIEAVVRNTDARSTRFALETLPNRPVGSRVTVIVDGPNDTVIAGFADGRLGLWHYRTGVLLRAGNLHGAIKHLQLENRKLYAASDFGQYLVWDLNVFYDSYCALVRQVWREVPVVWRNGRPAEALTPKEHPCATSR